MSSFMGGSLKLKGVNLTKLTKKDKKSKKKHKKSGKSDGKSNIGSKRPRETVPPELPVPVPIEEGKSFAATSSSRLTSSSSVSSSSQKPSSPVVSASDIKALREERVAAARLARSDDGIDRPLSKRRRRELQSAVDAGKAARERALAAGVKDAQLESALAAASRRRETGVAGEGEGRAGAAVAGGRGSELQAIGETQVEEEIDDGMTEAERKHAKYQAASEARAVARAAGSSHRERVERFNKKLADEPMHFDLFRIAAAGLG